MTTESAGERTGDGSSAEEPQPNAQAPIEHIQLVRIIDRTIHVSARDRTRELEFHVRNPTDRSFNVLYLPIPRFVQNLRVCDEDERRLNFVPNSIVKESLEELRNERPEDFERFQHRFRQARYKLCIRFPVQCPLEPNSIRSILLRFEDDDPVKFHRVSEPQWITGWFSHWKGKAFSLPQFSAEETRYPGHNHEHFFVVVGPPGYAVKWTTTVDGPRPSSNIYEDGLQEEGRVFSIRLPPAEDGLYTANITYELCPSRISTAKLLYVIFAVGVALGTLALLAGVAVAVFAIPEEARTVTEAIVAPIGRATAGTFAATSLAMMYALSEDWVERYKLLLLLPLILNVLAWLVWSIA